MYSSPNPATAAVCINMDTSISAESGGRRGGKNIASMLDVDKFILPHLQERKRERVGQGRRGEGEREGGREKT